MSRLILLVIVVAAGLWLYKNSAGGLLGSKDADPASQAAPLDRARDAAHRSEARQSELDRIGREASATDREAGRVHENMTPSEVRAMMGAPDEVTSGVSAAGAPQETWIYRRVGKKVVFENGIAISVD